MAEFAGCSATLAKSIGVAGTSEGDAMSTTLFGRIRRSLLAGRGSAKTAGLDKTGLEMATAVVEIARG